MKGVVLETFGAGNAPSNRPDLVAEFKRACENGVILLNITQCLKGSVSDAYAAGRVGEIHVFLAPNVMYLPKLCYEIRSIRCLRMEDLDPRCSFDQVDEKQCVTPFIQSYQVMYFSLSYWRKTLFFSSV